MLEWGPSTEIEDAAASQGQTVDVGVPECGDRSSPTAAYIPVAVTRRTQEGACSDA